jgi:hypothetical protein
MMTTSAVLQLSGRSRHKRHDAGVASDCNLQQPGDEMELAANLTDAHPPGLPLPNRMHGFVTLAGLVGSPERAEALARSHAPLDGRRCWWLGEQRSRTESLPI